MALQTFIGVEANVDDTGIHFNGNMHPYTAATVEEAASTCLAIERQKDPAAFMGPSGRVIHVGKRSIGFAKPK